jgi:branched-chain amino acid transport system substrate-binding protein
VIIKRDDTGLAPEVAKRVAQELVVADHVVALAGSVLTPDAVAVAQVSTAAHVPFFIVNAGALGILKNAPYAVRFGFTHGQMTQPLAQWAAHNGIASSYALYANYGAGAEIADSFGQYFSAAGGSLLGQIAMPYAATDFTAYLQRAKDAHPQSLLVFHNGRSGIALLKAATQAGFATSAVPLLAAVEVLDPNDLDLFGDGALGMVSAGNYTPSHDSKANREFVAAFRKAFGKERVPNYVACATYDAIGAIYRVAAAQGGALEPEKTMQLVRGMSFESPRGPVTIDAQTRDPIQNVYIRRVVKTAGGLAYREIATVPMVKDPAER